MSPFRMYNAYMNSDFERFTRIILDELHTMQKDASEFRNEFNEFRTGSRAAFATMNSRLSHLEKEIATISSRLDAIEESIADVRGYAKEIDDLRNRISDIERHLGVARKIPA